MSCPIDVVERAFQILNKDNSLLNYDGYKWEEVVPGVVKYFINENGIKHLLVYLDNNHITEVSVYCGEKIISLDDVRECFSAELVGYNFRENYTQFLYETGNVKYRHIAFILDNEIIFDESKRKYIEKTPRGKKTDLSEVIFNGFMLKKV